MPAADAISIITEHTLADWAAFPGLGANLPTRLKITARSPSWPGPVTIVALLHDGKQVVQSVCMERGSEAAGDVTGEALRSVPIARIVAQAFKAAGSPLAGAGGGEGLAGRADHRRSPRSPAEREELLRQVIAAAKAERSSGRGWRKRAAARVQLSETHFGKLLSEGRREPGLSVEEEER